MVERKFTAAEDARRDQAIAWHIRLDAPDAREADWLAFTEWLEADPANRLVFDRVETLDDELRSTDTPATEPPMAAHVSNTAARRHLLWFGGAGALLAATVAVFFVLQRTQPPAPQSIAYATQTGEAKTISLADGTRVDLNTASALSVEGNRRVTLTRGEALFHVTKDSAHPFVVTVGDRRVRVVGTVFDVLRADGMVTVTVGEGRVAVSRTAGDSANTQLDRGDRLTCIEGRDKQTAERVDPAEATSWRDGYLIYRNAPLSKVVADLNRYFAVEVVLEGNAGIQEFTGVLRVDNQNAVLHRLTEFLPVVTVRRPDGKIGLRQATPTP